MKNTALSWFAILFSIVVMFFGVKNTLVQHRKIETFQPVNVTVQSTEIKAHRSSGDGARSSTTYEPVVFYRYEVNGQIYTNGDVYPITETGSSSWARGIISKYSSGMELEGYYNPAFPNESILIPHYLFKPYLFTLIPLAILVSGLFGLAVPVKYPQPPVRRRSGRYVIKPGTSLKKGQFLSSLAFLLWAGIGLAALSHYFRNAVPPYETIAIIASVIYGAGFLGLLGYAIHRALLGKNVGEARLYTSTVKFQRGQSVKIEVQQAFKKDLMVVNAMVGIAVIEISRKGDGNKSRYVTRTVYEDWLPGVVSIQVPAKEVLSLSADVALPDHLMPGSRYNSRYPRYIWSFCYTLELANSPDFKTRYPIMVS